MDALKKFGKEAMVKVAAAQQNEVWARHDALLASQADSLAAATEGAPSLRRARSA